MSFSIVSDIGCDIPSELITGSEVNIINQPIMIDGVAELVDINSPKAVNEFYQKIDNVRVIKTEALLFDTAYKFINKIAESKDVLCFSFSQRLSATGMNIEKACLACRSLTQNNIFYFNTNTATVGQGLLIYKAIQFQREGRRLEEVISLLNNYAKRVRMFVALDINNNFNHGGRAEHMTHNDKYPILFLPKGGLYQTVGYFTNRMHQLMFLSEYVKRHKKDVVFIGHGSNQEEAQYFANKIDSSNSYCCYANPVMGAHTGNRALLCAYLE